MADFIRVSQLNNGKRVYEHELFNQVDENQKDDFGFDSPSLGIFIGKEGFAYKDSKSKKLIFIYDNANKNKDEYNFTVFNKPVYGDAYFGIAEVENDEFVAIDFSDGDLKDLFDLVAYELNDPEQKEFDESIIEYLGMHTPEELEETLKSGVEKILSDFTEDKTISK